MGKAIDVETFRQNLINIAKGDDLLVAILEETDKFEVVFEKLFKNKIRSDEQIEKLEEKYNLLHTKMAEKAEELSAEWLGKWKALQIEHDRLKSHISFMSALNRGEL